MAGTYQLWLYNSKGTQLALIDRYFELSYTRSVNDAGSLRLALPMVYPLAWFQRDTRIEVWRKFPGGRFYLDAESIWFVRRRHPYISNRQSFLEINAVSASELLSRRYVPFDADSDYSNKTLAYDDMLKVIVREQAGDLVADSARQIPGLQVQGNLTQTHSYTKAFAEQPVLQTLQEICQACATDEVNPLPLFFDIVPAAPGAMEFRTYTGQRGTDHTYSTGMRPVEFSTRRGNLNNPSLDDDWTEETTAAYAGGQTTSDESGATSQPIGSYVDVARASESPYNRREGWSSAPQYTTVTALNYEAAGTVRKGRARRIFTGTILNTNDCEYGKHWRWGDRVTVFEFGQKIDCRVDTITVTLSSGKEDITANLRSDDTA